VIHGVEAIKNGDVLGAVQAFMSVGLTAARGVSACNRVSTVVQWSQRALHGAAAGQMIISAAGKFANGDWFGGFVDLADAGSNLYMMGCFAAGTPLLTPTGSKKTKRGHRIFRDAFRLTIGVAGSGRKFGKRPA
jgi:hypothetical protein